MGIAYLETNGNIYYKADQIWLWVDRQKPLTAADTREKTGRAFTKTGLKLVFQFLLDPELLTMTYRDSKEYRSHVWKYQCSDE